MRLATALVVIALAVTACGSAEDEPAAGPDQPVEAPARHDTVTPPAKPAACRRLSRRLDGRSLEDARSLARKSRCALRVVSLDGEDLVVTEDFSNSRINVRVQSGRVAQVIGLY